MEIETFAAMTRRIIAQDGFDDFLPTACYPSRQEIVVLEGVPSGVDIEHAALNWATLRAERGEEFLVVFRSSIERFKIVRRVGSELEEAVYPIVVA